MTDTPTFNFRIRPEGSKYALKNRQTGNWFRHEDNDAIDNLDVSNFMTIQSVNNTPRIMSSRSQNYRRVQEVDSVRNNREKISDSDQGINWYNHEKNKNYRPPINIRLRSDDAKIIKQKQETQSYTSNLNDNNDPFTVNTLDIGNLIFSRTGINRNQALSNCNKIRGNHKTPNWFVHPENGDSNKENDDDANEEVIEMPKKRLTNEDALAYKDRNVNGYAGEYMVQDDDELFENGEEETNDWRPESRVGQHPRAESEVWFHHQEHHDQRPPSATPLRCPSRVAKETYEKSQGKAMLKIFQHFVLDDSKGSKNTGEINDENSNGDIPQNRHNSGKHYLNEAHRKNVVGTMKSLLDEKQNDNYIEPIQYQRAIKPEGIAISEKNKKGVIGECLTGYLDKAHAKEIHRTANVSDEFLKKHQGQNMALALVGNLPTTARFQAPRIIKPEGLANATRNKGSIKNLFNDLNDTPTDFGDVSQVGQRLRSNEARAIAKKYHYGSMKSLLF